MNNKNMKQVRKYGHIKDTRPHDMFKLVIQQKHLMKFGRTYGLGPVNGIFDLRTVYKISASDLDALSEIDQGQLGSCTANAIAYAYAMTEIKQKNKQVFLPSRLFIYYNERALEHTVSEDSGATMADGIFTLSKNGVVNEHLWPYDVDNFVTKPSPSLYKEAKKSVATKYATIDLSSNKKSSDRLSHLKLALQSGFPFVFGFMVYESFESPEVAMTGIMPMPQEYEQVLGGHAVCAVGYDDNKKSFIVKNSWGPSWGLKGYFYMPYDFMTDLNMTSDFWIIQKVSNPTNLLNFNPSDIRPYVVNLNTDNDNGGVVNPNINTNDNQDKNKSENKSESDANDTDTEFICDQN